jgi:hypothetical protein
MTRRESVCVLVWNEKWQRRKKLQKKHGSVRQEPDRKRKTRHYRIEDASTGLKTRHYKTEEASDYFS